MNIIPSNR